MKLPIILALASVACLARAQDVKYEKYTLSNGMTVILHEDHSLPVATVNIWYHVGSKDEPPHRSGFAHLFEHLMFMGTKRAPTGDFDRIMEAGGGTNNASTTQDRTNFFEYGPSGLLPTLLWLEADRLEALGGMMDQKKLDLQREVVKNERRENFENAPYGFVSLKIDEAMYPESHPYHIGTIGLTEDIDAAAVPDVKSFFATYYLPNNATMVVAGDFDPKTVKPLIASLFGTLPRGNDPIHKTAPEPALHEVKRLTMVDKVPQARTYMVWHSPPWYKPGDAEMDLIGSILTDGFASRLYQRLVVKDQLATDVSASEDSQFLGSLFSVVATAKEGVSLDKVEATIDEEIGRLLKTGPAADELARVKAKYEFSTLSGLQNLFDVADRLNQYDFYVGEPNSFKWDLERHTKPGPAEVQAWGRKVLDLNARLTLRVLPESVKLDQNARDNRPPVQPEKEFKPPMPEQFTLGNGLKVLYFSRPQLPLMTLSMLVHAGSTADPAEKSGLASMTASMLDQGAGSLDAEGFSKALDTLGASFSAGAGVNSTSATLSCTSAAFEKALPLFADAVIRPRMDGADFERQKGLHLDALSQDGDDPATVARLVAMREFFGAGHPLGRSPAGTPQTIKTLTVADVKKEHDDLFRPERATLVVAGALPRDQVRAALEKSLGGWKSSPLPTGKETGSSWLGPPGPRKPSTQIRTPNAERLTPNAFRVVIVDKPQAVQTVVRFIFPGEPYSSPNRIPLEGLSTVLGGTFTSRLNADLREAKGYTYGASANSVFEPQVGYMVAASSVRADVTGASLQEFLSEFAKLGSGDVTEEEAGKARTSMRTEIVGSLGSLGGLIGTAEEFDLNGLTMEELSRDLTALSNLSAAKMNPLAKRAVSLDAAVLVLVGDKDLILKQIAGLKLPKPEIVSGPW